MNAGGDALKSDQDNDDTKGYVSIMDGTVTLTSGGDGIDAYTDVIVTGGTLSITSGGGASTGKPPRARPRASSSDLHHRRRRHDQPSTPGMTRSTLMAPCA